MTPFHFGDSGSPLVGILDEPPKGAERGQGVLLCPPVGQENIRSHWALRQVGSALARLGFHCLRFDWFGVGDSSGRLCDATLERWRQDVRDAAQELRDAAGVRKISILGLRLGATLAALEATTLRPEAIVLWDPVSEGSAYVEELRSIQRNVLADTMRFSQTPPETLLRQSRACSPHELVGFEYGRALIESIERIHVADIAGLPRARVCLLESAPPEQQRALRELLSASNGSLEVRRTRMRSKWQNPDEVEELLLPADAIREITDFLEKRS